MSKQEHKMPPIEQLIDRTIGRILMKMGILTREQISKALAVQKKKGGKYKIGEILLKTKLVTKKQLQVAQAAQKGLEYINITDFDIDSELLGKIPAQVAETYKVLPIEFDEAKNTVTIAIDSIDNFRATDDIGKLTDLKVVAKITDTESLKAAIEQHYNSQEEDGQINDLIGEIQSDSLLSEFAGRDQSIDLDELKELSESNPVKKLLNLVLLQAIRDGASDVHFEPFEDEYKMRYRIDGVLYEMEAPPKHIASALSSRVKVMADLDIAERRLPQDGRISLTVHGNPIDLRVSILPTMFGESVVLRILDRSQVELDMERLGMGQKDLIRVRELIRKPNGIVIVTGPTGCGKTTTLYSALKELNAPETKIITTEDPVEYDIDGIIQVNIRSDIGLTFGKCLRSILRQDPDVVMVGEIRDLETAQIAAQASLTGHLVFSTIHTNDAPSSIARLLDLGVEPFLITATLEGIVAQRLIRLICPNCKTKFKPDKLQLTELALTEEEMDGKKFYYGKGCKKCNQTGYKGRTALFEVMTLNEEIRELIVNNASTNVLRDAAKKAGMTLLRHSGLEALFNGETTIDEVTKATIVD